VQQLRLEDPVEALVARNLVGVIEEAPRMEPDTAENPNNLLLDIIVFPIIKMPPQVSNIKLKSF
jgi:hypothetical protein